MKERIEKILKNKKILLSILIGIAFTISVSYAMYNIVLQGQRTHTITTSKLTFSYKEPLESLELLAYEPLTDEEGKISDNYYEFTVKATSDAAEVIDYVIYLQKEESDNSFSPSDIKVYLTKIQDSAEVAVVNPTLISDLSEFNETENTSALYGSNFIFTEDDLTNKEETYRLRIWLKSNFKFSDYITSTTTDGEQNIKLDSYEYKFKVNVATGEMPEKSIQKDSSNASVPALASNMIPVIYDEANKVWVKADESNSNLSWFDYSNKKWANAITVGGYKYETLETNKSINLQNQRISKQYYSNSNSWENGTTSSSIFTFTSGSNGNYSFDWAISSEAGYDKLTVKINDMVVLDGKSGIESGTYTGEATIGTTYTIVATYTKNDEDTYYDFEDNAIIGNFVLPEGSTEIIHSANESYPDYMWNSYNVITNQHNFYESFTLKDGKFVLSYGSNDDYIGNKFICSDLLSNSCDEIYEVLEYNDNEITLVNRYDDIVSVDRNYYINAPIGTPIEINNINTMMVWIPRFSATGDTANYNGGTKEAPGAFDITFVDKETSAHDAFTFDGDNKEGFWIGKFEVTGKMLGACTNESCDISNVNILPNSTSITNQKASEFFYISKKMELTGNQYGFNKTIDTSLDVHMLKNNEWGAVTYLTQSIYGRCSSSTNCEEIENKNCGSAESAETIYDNNYLTSRLQSTTGNIYGVYDMSGGEEEIVMGFYKPDVLNGITDYSGFSSVIENSQYDKLPNVKYYNAYSTEEEYNGLSLQHAMFETKGWYADKSEFVYEEWPWIIRGGSCMLDTGNGIFSYSFASGGIYKGTRIAVVN